MKKQLLNLSLVIGASLLMGTAMAQIPTANFQKANYNCTPVLDGQATDDVWSKIDAVNIDRNFTGETPTLNSATWKAFWVDTAIYVLVEISDDSFWPSWKSELSDWASDKVETYFDVSDHAVEGDGPDNGDEVAAGNYQVTDNWFEEKMGYDSVNNGRHFANTYNFEAPATLVYEYTVPFSTLTANDVAYDPTSGEPFGFDVTISDLDETSEGARQRAVWSNIGGAGESWNNLDSIGEITFVATDEVSCIVGVNPVTYNPSLISSTLVNDVLIVSDEVVEVTLYNTAGVVVKQVKNTNRVELYGLSRGMYIVAMTTKDGQKASAKIVK